MRRSALLCSRPRCPHLGLAATAATCLVFVLVLLLNGSAQALPLASRGEIISRAYSALYTPYAQQGTHIKSYQPDEAIDEGPGNCGEEPFTDCSGLLQKCWQVPRQLYPGEPIPSGEQISAAMFRAGRAGSWYLIGQSSLVKGDGLASTGHAVVFIENVNGFWWIIEAIGPVVYRQFPYQPTAYQAIRRSDIEGAYTSEVYLDNNTARQRYGPANTYGCAYFSDWTKSTVVTGFKGTDYQIHAGSDSPEATVRYTPWLPVSGYYNVYMWVPVSTGFSDNAKVTVRDAYGSTIYYVNERTGAGAWKPLGQHYFYNNYSPSSGCVIISTAGSTAYETVVADKVWFSLAQ